MAAQVPKSLSHWWLYTQALSADGMEGRDTGTDGYRRAAAYVISQFQRAGLQPAGSRGYYQAVPLHEIKFIDQTSSVRLIRSRGKQDLHWLKDITVSAAMDTPKVVSGPLIFLGTNQATASLKGKIVVTLRGASGSSASEQLEGVAGTITIDSTAGPEPPRWPIPYSVAMRLSDDPLPVASHVIAFRFNPASADKLLAFSGHSYRELKAMADAGKPLPTFEIPASLEVTMNFESKDLTSDNIIAALPGSDPQLSKHYIAVSAHLDGYGFGQPRNDDPIYNGTFDDAAYVATLIDLAEKLHRTSAHLRRSLLFCVFTGEEKGLLGSKYFTTHLTVSRERLAADINLDQLRPIFPLKILTTLAVNDSSLGEAAKEIAKGMGIRIQPDPEPERNLLRRSDHYNFMQIGVPSIGFIFGYAKGSPEEVIYRRWYAERYHSPADDLNQPWDPIAAAKFNEFFDRLVVKLANDPERPAWRTESPFANLSRN